MLCLSLDLSLSDEFCSTFFSNHHRRIKGKEVVSHWSHGAQTRLLPSVRWSISSAFPTTSDHSGKSSSHPLREAPDHEVQSADLARHDSFLKGIIAEHFFYKNFKRQVRQLNSWGPGLFLWMVPFQASFITILKTHSWLSFPDGPEVLRIVTQISVLVIWGMFEHFKLDERLETEVWTISVVYRVNNWRLEPHQWLETPVSDVK